MPEGEIELRWGGQKRGGTSDIQTERKGQEKDE